MPNTADAARQLGCSPQFVRRLAARGEFLAAVRRAPHEGGWWIPTAALDAYRRKHNQQMETSA